MKSLAKVRESMAERGIELTPKQAGRMVRDVMRLSARLKRRSECAFDLTHEQKQKLRNELAEIGDEVTLSELEALLDIAKRIRDLPFD